MATNISQPIFTDPGYTFEDVSYWQSPTVPTGSPDMLVFTYKPNEIKEWYVSSNVVPTLNRTINLGQTLGKGLTNVTQFKLLSAEFGVYEIDLINSTNTNASITTLFTLPGGYKCTGDISFDATSNLMLVLYNNEGSSPVAVTYKLGKYNYNGILLDEYIIPSGLLSGSTDKFDGIICNIGPLQSKYVVSQSGLLFEIIESPILSIVPIPYSNVSAIFNTGSINTVTGAEGMCGCLIGVPETYDCIDNPPGSTTLMCVDPGTGLGQYTYQTAINGGYVSALDECETECTNDCTSWSCVTSTTSLSDTCSTQILMPSLVTTLTDAFDWMSLNGINTLFQDYKFESGVNYGFPNSCLGVNGNSLQKPINIQCGACLDPVMQQNFNNLADFILIANGLGIGVSLGQTRTQMNLTISNHYNINNSNIIVINGALCICVTNSSISCVEVSGTSGYATEQECLKYCSPKKPSPNCASVYAIPVCNTGGNTQADPLTQTINCCITVDGLTPTNGLVGSIIEDPTTNIKYKISNIDPCRPVMGCSCTNPYNYTSSQCGVPNIVRGAAPESNRCLSVDCPKGLLWDYNTCSCMSYRETTVFVGDSAHISVMVSDFMKKGLGEVTSKVDETTQLLEVKAYNCNSDNGNKGNNLFDGCLSKEGENSHNYRWNSNEQNPLSTFTCVDGLCIELVGNSGGFSTLVECIQNCDTIGGDGSRPSFLPTLEKTTEVICLPETKSTINNNNTSINNNVRGDVGYVCQTTLNTLVGEYQKACVPQSKSMPTPDSVLYSSISDCLGNCGGWFNCNVDNIEVDGVYLETNQASPVVMCCESYIMKATEKLTVQSCSRNCCDGTDIWFPLYNVFGINQDVPTSLSYSDRRLSSLVNSQICTVSETKNTYTNSGIGVVSNNMVISGCADDEMTYVDGIPCYGTVIEALSDAGVRGCTGYHTHMVNGKICYMACESHSQSMGGGVSAREMMGDGPCICRQYQTGPDGLSKCIKWSPAGCGDNVMMTSNSPTRIDTPSTTPPGLSGRGMSSGGGY
tara:strand:- start:604 stop:3696 length:3093 start_codon:yes stop_codon:yes gene_type:complete